MKKGIVYLVGAGPGDPGLLTLKGAECLGRADVVVYDFLANPVLLAHASPEAEMIYVGKKGSDHTLGQAEINQLIVDLAQGGKTVVRLKGGDPYIFGRGGEEAEELYEAGVPFQVVPGISSVVAAPAYAGIPLTHRDHTSHVSFVTGHEDPTKEKSALDWDRLAAGQGTLVFVMGVKNLEKISRNLVQGGRAGSTPAALVRWGTTPDQTSLVGTLDDIADKARAAGLKPPAVLVVGGVVGLRSRLNWFESLPLFGRRILVTRTREQASRLTGSLTALGARVIECPTIRLVPPSSWEPVDRAIGVLPEFDWLVLTSPNGVRFFMDRLWENGFDARALAGVKLAAIGPATADMLQSYGLRTDLLPEKYVAESLVEALVREGVEAKKILLARAADARDVLPDELTAAGARVQVAALYRTLAPEGLTREALDALDEGRIDMVTFTSSSTVTNMVRLLGDRLDAFKTGVRAAAIGPITAETARKAGIVPVTEAREHTIDGLVQAILEYFSS